MHTEFLKYDPNVSIEGIATALGVLGAAIGYLFSLGRDWVKDYRDRRKRGTNFVLLALLEQHLLTGLPKNELLKMYQDKSTADLRKRYHARSPTQLDEIELERHLKQLQFDFLIDLASHDRYRIRFKPLTDYDKKEYEQKEIAATARTKITAEQLRSVARKVLQDEKSPQYLSRMAVSLLVRLKDIDVAVDTLKSKNIETALAAADVLADFVSDSNG